MEITCIRHHWIVRITLTRSVTGDISKINGIAEPAGGAGARTSFIVSSFTMEHSSIRIHFWGDRSDRGRC